MRALLATPLHLLANAAALGACVCIVLGIMAEDVARWVRGA